MNNEIIIEYLKEFVSSNRFSLFKRIVEERTRYVSVLIENVYQSHNASAIIRTCEALGIQDLYVFERKNSFSPNDEIALGGDKWINIFKYNEQNHSFKTLINDLKKKNYRIIATSLQPESKSIYDLDLKKGKTIFLFGTEISGLSEEAISLADESIKIPIFGFTESFNVSVSVGIILNYVANELRKQNIPYHLTKEEKDEILVSWLVQSIPYGSKILERFLKQHHLQKNINK